MEIDMKDCLRHYHINLIAVSFLLSMILPPIGKNMVYSAEHDSNHAKISVKNAMISVDLENALLGEVLKEIKAQSKIKFTVDESLLQEKLSVKFEDLPLQEGLERILASMSYGLVFDQDGTLAEVKLIGKRKTSRMAQGTGISPEPVAPSNEGSVVEGAIGGSEVDQSVSTPGGSVEMTDEEAEQFKVIKNAPPPGGPVEMSEEEREQFRIIKNSPPPGD
jgi:type II secretory pathway component GspD/PulD (secretin)